MRIRIVNWSQYQHYRNRCPPWVKVHWSLLTSDTWVTLDDASRVLVIASMMLASRDKATDGSFNGTPEYVRRVCYLNTPPDWGPLLAVGFVELVDDASKTLADASTMQAKCCSETETETEKENPLTPKGAGDSELESEDPEGKAALVHAQPPIAKPWTRLAEPERIQTIVRLLTASDATPAYNAAWRAAARELAACDADFIAVKDALNRRVNDPEPRFAPKLPPANRLKAAWFLSLVQHYATNGVNR